MPHAGEIRFNTKIDNSQAQKDLDDLNRKIRKANEDISRLWPIPLLIRGCTSML